MRISPNAVRTYSCGGSTLKYEMPSQDVTVSGVFEAMAEAKRGGALRVMDWSVLNATLEEVFIKLARQIGAETGQFH
jgi:hypothetical protein